jgi:serine protease Do
MKIKRIALQLICLAAIGAVQLHADSTTRPTSPPSVEVLQTETMDVAPKCVACTVGLVSIMQEGNRTGIASGSGVLVSSDGLILTAGHVIQAPGNKITIRFTDGKVVQGVAVGLDHQADTGMVRITDPAPAGGWSFCKMAADKSAAVGEWVLATGNPGSIVVDRDPPLRLGRVTGHDAESVDTNCALEPGDSGGPLFNLAGEVIGINSRIMTSSGNYHPDEYLSMHVPIAMFTAQWKELLSGINANPDANLDGRHPPAPKPVPGISNRVRGALNALAADNDPDAVQLLADEKKNGKLTPTPAQMNRLLKLAAQMDRAASTQPGSAPKVAAAPTTKPPTTKPPTTKPPTTKPAAQLARDTAPPEEMGGLPSNRAALEVRKNSLLTLSLFVPAMETAGDCVVEIRDGSQVALLGTIVGSDGWIVTKASDLPANPRVMMPDGQVVKPKVIGKDKATDLALLKVNFTGLTAANFDSNPAKLGEWIGAPTANPNQPAVGVVSHIARSIPETFAHFEGEQKIVLGVGFEGPTGCVIRQITKGMPAEAAGMKIGDEVFQLNGQPVTSHDQFVAELKKSKAGDTLSIMVHRAGKDIELKPTIGQAKATTQTANSVGEADNVAGGKLSKRRTDFPQAIQTDAAIWADQCGGPLIDLQGQVIGVTIARYDRVCTFALPAELVKTTVEKLKAAE